MSVTRQLIRKPVKKVLTIQQIATEPLAAQDVRNAKRLHDSPGRAEDSRSHPGMRGEDLLWNGLEKHSRTCALVF